MERFNLFCMSVNTFVIQLWLATCVSSSVKEMQTSEH